MRKAFPILVALAFVIAACGPGATPSESTPPDPTTTSPPPEGDAPPPTEPPAEPSPPTLTPTLEPTIPPAIIDVEIEGAEGLMLKGTFYRATPNAAPGVLMLHMYGRTRADWDNLAKFLQSMGIACLAIDLRGHGETGGVEDWELAPLDVVAALDWLAARDDVDAEHLGAWPETSHVRHQEPDRQHHVQPQQSEEHHQQDPASQGAYPPEAHRGYGARDDCVPFDRY